MAKKMTKTMIKKRDKCAKDLQHEGMAKGRSYAICTSSQMKKKGKSKR